MSTDVAGLLGSMQEAARQLAAERQRADNALVVATELRELMHKYEDRAERLEAALRSIADYTQDGLNGECSLCYFKIEGLTTHRAECPWPAALGSMRTIEP